MDLIDLKIAMKISRVNSTYLYKGAKYFNRKTKTFFLKLFDAKTSPEMFHFYFFLKKNKKFSKFE
jgi:hypothetical protein